MDKRHPVDAFNDLSAELGVVTYMKPGAEDGHFREEVEDAAKYGGTSIRYVGDVFVISKARLSDEQAAAFQAALAAMEADDPRFSLVRP